MGYLGGAAAGRLLEKEKLNFAVSGKPREHLARALIGLGLIALIIPVAEAVFPYNHHLLIFSRHALSTFWVTYLAPLFFLRVGLARVNSKF